MLRIRLKTSVAAPAGAAIHPIPRVFSCRLQGLLRRWTRCRALRTRTNVSCRGHHRRVGRCRGMLTAKRVLPHGRGIAPSSTSLEVAARAAPVVLSAARAAADVRKLRRSMLIEISFPIGPMTCRSCDGSMLIVERCRNISAQNW